MNKIVILVFMSMVVVFGSVLYVSHHLEYKEDKERMERDLMRIEEHLKKEHHPTIMSEEEIEAHTKLIGEIFKRTIGIIENE